MVITKWSKQVLELNNLLIYLAFQQAFLNLILLPTKTMFLQSSLKIILYYLIEILNHSYLNCLNLLLVFLVI